jgi:hypothetical protein
VRFWDTSAIVPLLVAQPASPAVLAELETDPVLVVWWATEIECASAIARLERERTLDSREVVAATGRVAALAASWQEVQPVPRVRLIAARLLRVHPLRAADAFQLAAAIVAADDDPRSLPLITLDDRLADAADREGFPVIVPPPVST